MKKYFTFISILLFTACMPNEEIPEGVMPPIKMQAIIWDMSLADNMASDKYALNRDSQSIMVTGLYQKVFSLHKIDKSTFYKSYAYYEAHPTQLQVLFDSVTAYGNREKAKSYQRNFKDSTNK